MSYALMSSGGKDSTLALYRARLRGLDVRYLVNTFHGPSGRVAFHGTRSELIAAHAVAQALEHVGCATEQDTFESVFAGVLSDLSDRGVHGMVFGNIHLADVRAWYEERVRAAGLEHVEPLWGERPSDIVREVIALGFDATVVSVDLAQAPEELLGQTLGPAFEELLARHPQVDACGERGEYHTYVSAGPTFRTAIDIERGSNRREGQQAYLDLSIPGRAA